MKDYDKTYAIKQMNKLLRAKNSLLRLRQRTITELADHLGVHPNSLYKLYEAKTGNKWKDVMPYQIIIRKNSGLEEYQKRSML